MARPERPRPMTDDELDALAEAVDDLGERVVRALAEETGRPVEEFDIDPDDYEFPEPAGAGRDRLDR